MNVAVNEFRFDKDGQGDDVPFRLANSITLMTGDSFQFPTDD